MRKSTFTTAGAALVLAAVLSGCSGAVGAAEPAGKASTASTAKPTATATPSPVKTTTAPAPPADGGKYASLPELKAAAMAAGLSCTNWAPKELKFGTGGDCGAGGTDILTLYPDAASLADQLGTWEGFGKMVSMKVLVGKNWTINSASASTLQKTLGGQIFTTPGK